MTPQEKLHAVETAIRKALPRLMELSEGVWVKRILKPGMMPGADTRPLKLIDYGDKNSFLAIRMDGTLPPKPTKIFKDEVGDKYEIIGHDTLLADMLEWLEGIIAGNYIINLQTNGVLVYEYYSELTRSKEVIKSIDINLSKPRLVDQSEEFINFLYNLIQKQNERNKI